ncbi:MAG: cytochrome c oxidase subunit II [Ignavibacteria bacterium]|nr:cytochrome c oxidase subunit II [Ignavibacteria bacterium]
MRPNIIEQVDTTFIITIGISFFLLIVITITMIVFVFRYNKKRNPVPSNISGNTLLEIIWTVIPLILVMIIFFSGYTGFKNMRDAPENSMVVKVTGQMWKWTFEYANKKISDTLFVPVGQPIKLEIYSVDVNHSLYLPAFRVKEDAIPGRVNYLWFQPMYEGTFDIACAEYCGLSHSLMYSKLVVLPENEFYEWYNKSQPIDSTINIRNTDTQK